MGFSPLADMRRRIPDGGRYNYRNSAVTGMGLHHNAGVDAYSEAWNPNREVSANYWIANDGTIIPNVDESLRAFTSGAAGYPAGAQADHRNITVEISNSPEGVRTGSWAISDAAMTSLIRLIADVWQRYGLGLVQRSAYQGLGVHQDWVPTSCPGPYIMGNLGNTINAANRIITEGEDDMFSDADRATLNAIKAQTDADRATLNAIKAQTSQTKAIYDALFKREETSQGYHAGVLPMLNAVYDAQFKEDETSRGTPGGTLVSLREVISKLEELKAILDPEGEEGAVGEEE